MIKKYEKHGNFDLNFRKVQIYYKTVKIHRLRFRCFVLAELKRKRINVVSILFYFAAAGQHCGTVKGIL
jgi:hypothetical protein